MPLLTFSTHTPSIKPTPTLPDLARRRQLEDQVANYSQEEARFALQKSQHRQRCYQDELIQRKEQGIPGNDDLIQQEIQDEKEMQRLLNQKLQPGWSTRTVEVVGLLLLVGIGKRLLQTFASKA